MLIRAHSVITPHGEESNLVLRIEEGIIAEFSRDENLKADIEVEGVLMPGFIDIHCHGGAGHYFSAESSEDISRAIALHRTHGTTTLLASLVTAPIPQLIEQIKRLAPFVDSGELAGIHLEGPYLSPARCGAHDPALLRNPELSEVKQLLAAGEGSIAMITIAPELPGALEVITYLISEGVVAALGHSDATPDQMKAGVEAGGSVVTHFHNAMQKFEEGKFTTSNYLKEESGLPLELILDGAHVSEEIAKELLLHHSNRAILITDAMSAAGCGDGEYRIGELDVVVENEVARLSSNSALAGSTLTMERAFFNALNLGISLPDVVRMTSTNAANLFGWYQLGRIEIGAVAEFLVADLDKSTLKTFVN
jgi:N-acetylglucosamine-6-phosphate deacetylase